MFNIAKQKNRPMILIGGWQMTLEKRNWKRRRKKLLNTYRTISKSISPISLYIRLSVARRSESKVEELEQEEQNYRSFMWNRLQIKFFFLLRLVKNVGTP